MDTESEDNPMNQTERRKYLIRYLLDEHPEYHALPVPNDINEQKTVLRSLMNIRRPAPISREFLTIQDAYLQEELQTRGITGIESLVPLKDDLYLWQGDITTLQCDAVVNAANSGMTGCYVPCHKCIDNCIHTYAGIQLRSYCDSMMKQQGTEEPTGSAKITPAGNLPCKYVIHTVGPIIYDAVTPKDRALLSSCYRSCLTIAEQNQLSSIAFCCISTGEFRFPNQEAAEIAVQTVTAFKAETGSHIKVIFNVFKDLDYGIYRKLLIAEQENNR